MAKYIKKFTNHTGYETFINGSDVVLPVVSHCVQEKDVHYNGIPQPLTITYNVRSVDIQYGLQLYRVDTNSEEVRRGIDEFESIEFNGTSLNISDIDSNGGRYTPSSTGIFECKFALKDSSTILSKMFMGCDSIVSVNIPNGVTSIGEYAFKANNSLMTTVTLPSSVNTIGDYAFCQDHLDQASYNAITAINTNAVGGCGVD